MQAVKQRKNNNAQVKAKRQKPQPGSKRSTKRKANRQKRREKRNEFRQTVLTKDQLQRDPRTATALNTGATVSSSQTAIPMFSPWVQQAFQGPIFSYLTKAYERGIGGSSGSIQPFQAAQFMFTTFANAAQGNFPQAQKVPYWFLALMRAVMPKPARFVTGQVTYAWFEVNPAVAMTTETVIGYIPYGKKYIIGPVDASSLVNGFPTIDTTTPSYNAVAGADAFQVLSQFMMQGRSKAWAQRASSMVALDAKTSLDKDPSAFAVNDQAQGVGSGGAQAGGIAMVQQLEVPVKTPLLGLMGCLTNSFGGATGRMFNRPRQFAGDTLLISAMMSEALPESMWSFKVPPKYYTVDVLRFCDVLAKWATAIIQGYLNDVPQAELPQPEVFTCPLTLQEMCLLLINVIKQAFKDSQYAVQAVYPYTPLSANDNQFVPLIVSAGTAFIQAIDMKLPMPMIENLRSLVSVNLYQPGREFAFECLLAQAGQYVQDVLNESDYLAQSTNGPSVVVYNTFKSSLAVWEKHVWDDKSASYKKESMAETAINFIDGASSSGFVAINDPARLKFLATLWNEWLAGPVGSYTVSLGNFSTENGAPVMRSIGMHNLWTFGNIELLRSKKRSEIQKGEEKLMKRKSQKQLVKHVDRRATKKATLQSPFVNRFIVANISRGEILAAPYEQVLSVWILPSIQVEDNSEVNDLLVPRVQALYGEPILTPTTTGSDGISMDDHHQSYALKMTKAKLAEPDDWINVINNFSAAGAGGVLSGLLASVVGAAFPQVADIAHGVASVLPI